MIKNVELGGFAPAAEAGGSVLDMDPTAHMSGSKFGAELGAPVIFEPTATGVGSIAVKTLGLDGFGTDRAGGHIFAGFVSDEKVTL